MKRLAAFLRRLADFMDPKPIEFVVGFDSAKPGDDRTAEYGVRADRFTEVDAATGVSLTVYRREGEQENIKATNRLNAVRIREVDPQQ